MPRTAESDSEQLPHKPLRRSQAERSRLTRTRVCEATLAALNEVGHERISTSMIAQKARVSRGALTHHFPTRNDLLVAALRHLHQSWGEGSPFGADPETTSYSLVELTDALWAGIFTDPRYMAAVELMLAARLDSDLGRGLRDEMEGWLARRDRNVARLMGYEPGDEQETLYLYLTLSVLRGIAVHRSFDHDETLQPRLVELWKSILRRAMPAQEDGATAPRLTTMS